MKKKHLVMVLTEPTEGQEDTFNDYYENTHLEEVLKTTDLSSAQRYRLAGEAGSGAPLPYLAVYEAEAESAQSILNDMHESRSEREQSDALNRRTARIWVFEAIGQKHT